MRIEIVKRADGAGLLRCTRRDGSVTWQKQSERVAAHFTHHDLTHFAVETTLERRRGFFGLVASGWEIEDTTGKGSRGPLPEEALEVERIVGLFDAERGSGALWTGAEFGLPDEAILAVRARRSDLFRRWRETDTGAALELEFPE